MFKHASGEIWNGDCIEKDLGYYLASCGKIYGVSSGMRLGIERARRDGRVVEFRRIGKS